MFTPDKIKDLRLRAKLSQQEFADEIGVARELISKMEAGKKPISRATQILLTDYVKKSGTEDTQSPDPVLESGDVNAKYVALLERQESRAIDIGESAARAAVDRMAERFASKEEVKTLVVSLGELTAEVRRNMNQNLTFQDAAAILYSEVGNLLPKDARNRIDTLMLEIATGQRTDKIPGSGTQSKARW